MLTVSLRDGDSRREPFLLKSSDFVPVPASVGGTSCRAASQGPARRWAAVSWGNSPSSGTGRAGEFLLCVSHRDNK